MRAEEYKRVRRQDLLGTTLTEIMMLLVFIFLVVVGAASAETQVAREKASHAEAAAKAYRNRVQAVLDELGVGLKDLPRHWSRLVNLEKLEKKHKEILDEMARREVAHLTLRKEKEEIEKNRQALQDRVKAVERAMAEAEKKTRNTLTRELAGAQETVERLKREMSDQRKSLSAAQDRDETLKRDLEEARSAIARLSSQLAGEKKTVATNQNRTATLKRELADATAEVKRLTKELSAKSQSSASKDKQKTALESNLNSANAVIKRLVKEVAGLKQALSSENKRIAALQEALGWSAEDEEEEEKGDGDPFGRTDPPCWTDTYGNIEYTLHVIMRDNGFVLRRAWPASRDDDARALGLFGIPLGSLVSTNRFKTLGNRILQADRSRGCHFWVEISDETNSKISYKKKMQTIESFYYKKLIQ